MPAASPDRHLTVRVGQFTSAGRKEINQDSLAARLPEGFELSVKGAVFAVADGISSSSCSQVAAQTAVKSFVADYYATPEAWSTRTAAGRVIEATNSWLYAENRRARLSDMNHGLVCTLSVLILKGREAHIFHVGDSRVSRLQGAAIEPLTRDHVTVVSDSEHYLGRALGAQERVEIDYLRLPVAAGDLFMLSTDGIHEHVGSQQLLSALKAPTLDTAAADLARAALAGGSTDNLTVQLVQIKTLSDKAPSVPEMEGLPPAGELQPGDSIDGFQLVREIHATERSRLFLARDPSGAKVALKLPAYEARDDADHLQRFTYEEWVASLIRSPHVVGAAPCSEARTASYVALQWIDGMTLRQWTRDRPRASLDEVRDIAEQLAKGLYALHRREMIHQDLRPENIMLSRDGTAVIVDLGSVAVAGLDEAFPGLLGDLAGTYQYTAPEYLSGDIVSWRSDQYALGVIVYELLTGRLPYGAAAGRVRNRRDQQRLSYQTARLDDNGIPAWVDFALARACHRDPMRRYDVLSEFVADLRTPSRSFRPRSIQPLAERYPVRFWKTIAFLEACLITSLVILMLR